MLIGILSQAVFTVPELSTIVPRYLQEIGYTKPEDAQVPSITIHNEVISPYPWMQNTNWYDIARV